MDDVHDPRVSPTSSKNGVATWVLSLLAFLEGGLYVRTYDQLARRSGRSIAHTRRALGPHVRSSLNMGKAYVASRKTVRRQADRLGLWRHERSGAVSHRRHSSTRSFPAVRSSVTTSARADPCPTGIGPPMNQGPPWPRAAPGLGNGASRQC